MKLYKDLVQDLMTKLQRYSGDHSLHGSGINLLAVEKKRKPFIDSD